MPLCLHCDLILNGKGEKENKTKYQHLGEVMQAQNKTLEEMGKWGARARMTVVFGEISNLLRN